MLNVANRVPEAGANSTLHSSLSTLVFAVDEVPTQVPDLVVSLSIAPGSDLTANLIIALRAARGNARCPSEANVRAVNFCGGEPRRFSRRGLPSNPPPTRIAFIPLPNIHSARTVSHASIMLSGLWSLVSCKNCFIMIIDKKRRDTL